MDVTGPGTAGWIGCRVPHWERWIFEGDCDVLLLCAVACAVPSAVHILLALALVRKHGSAVVQATNQVGGVVLTHRLGSVCFIASGWRLPSFNWPRHGDDAVTRLTGFAGGADCFLAVCELGLLPFLGHRLVSVVWL